MKTLNHLFLFVILILLSGEIVAQENSPPAPKFGKCYAKCNLPIKYEVIEGTFDIFLGDSTDGIEFDSLYFYVESKTGDLIYLGAESDLTRKQRRQIENFVKIVFVKDSNGINDEIVEEIYTYKERVGGGDIGWVEIVCQADVGSSMLKEVQNILNEEGYLNTQFITGRMDAEVRKALTQYQEENNLPVGNLNIKTLEAMGVL